MGKATRAIIVLGSAALAYVLLGTTHEDSPLPAPPTSERLQRPTTVSVAGRNIDVATIINNTRYQFTRLNNTYVGGGYSYASSISNDSIQITPDFGDRKQRPPLTIQTREVERGANRLLVSKAYLPADDGHLQRRIAGGQEDIRNTSAGIHQSWTFSEKPTGIGDLTVLVAIDGYQYTSTTSSGLHFSSGDSLISYSHATWIDASGRPTQVLAEYSRGVIQLRVPADILEGSAYPAVLDPTAGPEYDVDTPVLEPAADSQQAPVIASSRGDAPFDFLIVWQDRRRSLNLTFDIFGTYLSRSGILQTQVGFLITPEHASTTDELSPAVSFSATGNNFAVLYTDTSVTPQAIIGVTLPCTHIGSGGSCSTTPSSGKLISSGLAAGTSAHLGIWDYAGQFTAAWIENSQVMIRLLDTTLTPVPSTSIVNVTQDPTSVFQSPSIACNEYPGNNWAPGCIVAFTSNRGPGGIAQIEAAQITNGTVEQYNNGGTMVSTFVVGTVKVGATTKPCVRPSVSTFPEPALTEQWLIAFNCNMNTITNPNYDVYAEMVMKNGGSGATLPNVYPNDGVTPSNPVPMVVASGSGQQVYPSVSYGTQSNAIITWTDNAGTLGGLTYQVKAQRYLHTGCGTSPCGFAPNGAQIIIGGSSSNSTSPSVSSDASSQYVSVWADSRNNGLLDIYDAFVGIASGSLNYIALASSSSNQETGGVIAKCGASFLVAWSDSRNNADTDIYGEILNSSGSPQGSSFLIGGGYGDQDQPAIGCDGTNFLVTWTDRRNSTPNIYYNVVSQTGAVTYTNGHVIVNAIEADIESAIAFQPSPAYWWVAWSYNTSEIHAQRIDSSTKLPVGPVVVVDPNDVTMKIGSVENPDLDYDASNNNLLVVWQGTKASSSDLDIYGVRLNLSGSLGSQFSIDANTTMTTNPRVRFIPQNNIASVIFEDFDGTANFIRVRAVGTTVGAAAPIAGGVVQNSHPRITNRDSRTQEVVYYTSDATDAFNYNSYGRSLIYNSPSGSAYTISAQSGIREMTPDISCQSATQCISVFRQFDDNDTSKIDRVKASIITY